MNKKEYYIPKKPNKVYDLFNGLMLRGVALEK